MSADRAATDVLIGYASTASVTCWSDYVTLASHALAAINKLQKILPTFVFFFNDTASTDIYTLSLHDALPIFKGSGTISDMGDNVLTVARNRKKEKERKIGRAHV